MCHLSTVHPIYLAIYEFQTFTSTRMFIYVVKHTIYKQKNPHKINILYLKL